MGFFFNTTKTSEQIISDAEANYKQVQLNVHKENILNMTEQLSKKGVLEVAVSLHNSLESYKMLLPMDELKQHKLGLDYQLSVKNGYTKIDKIS